MRNAPFPEGFSPIEALTEIQRYNRVAQAADYLDKIAPSHWQSDDKRQIVQFMIGWAENVGYDIIRARAALSDAGEERA